MTQTANSPLPLPSGFDHRIRKRFTLAFIEKNGQVLLGLKKRGFGVGLWNGFGGKVEPNESNHAAAVREIEEECGLFVKLSDLEEVGVILFEFIGDPVLMEVHLFKAETFSGQVQESEEMTPKWFPAEALPHSQMFPDDEIWYPLYRQRRKFNAYFLFRGITEMISYVLRDPEGKIISEKISQSTHCDT